MKDSTKGLLLVFALLCTGIVIGAHCGSFIVGLAGLGVLTVVAVFIFSTLSAKANGAGK